MRSRHAYPLVLLLVLSLPGVVYALDLQLPATSAQIYFSPKGGAQEALVKALGQAEESIYIQAYSFTSAPIAEALVAAYKRGVKVEAILDKSQRTKKYSGATFLANAGIPVFIDAAHAIAHNKGSPHQTEICVR